MANHCTEYLAHIKYQHPKQSIGTYDRFVNETNKKPNFKNKKIFKKKEKHQEQ